MANTLLNSALEVIEAPRTALTRRLTRTWLASVFMMIMIFALDLFDPGITILLVILIGPGAFALLVAAVAIRRREKSSLVIGLVCALLIAGGTAAIVEQQYRQRQDFLANAHHTEGVVIEHYELEYKWGVEFHLKYRFTLPADGSLDPKDVVAESEVRARRFRGAPAGTSVPVRYDPRDPTHAEIDVNEESELLPYVDAVAAALLFGFILACQAASARRNWSSRRSTAISEI